MLASTAVDYLYVTRLHRATATYDGILLLYATNTY